MAEPAMSSSPPIRAELRRLVVRGFRNLERLDTSVPADGVAVVGENGHGKTNLLEAIYYLQLQRSFRGARDAELVRFDEDAFHLSAEVRGGSARLVSVGFARNARRKKIVLDGQEVQRLSDAIGALPAVIFSPADVGLVSGSPGARRHYLDVVLALTSRPYLRALQRYRTALAHRNAALRQDVRNAAEHASVWEPALAEHGAVIWRGRAHWAAEHTERFAELCAAIGESGRAELRLARSVQGDGDTEERLREALARRRRLDLLRGMTQSGPHRDDMVLTLDGRELRAFGSSGQQRTAAIALRLLEAATLRSALGLDPLLLLDDPFAELDTRRTARILGLLLAEREMGQWVLTVPRETDIPRELLRLERWTIRHGALTHER